MNVAVGTLEFGVSLFRLIKNKNLGLVVLS